MCITQIICCLFLLSFSLHGSAEKIRVDVSYSLYSNSRDEMKFYTKDTNICSKFNAKYKSRSSLFNTVTCECRNFESFFGINGQKLSCKKESTNLYGCSVSYSQRLPRYKSTGILKVTFHYSRCEHPVYYSLQSWNGNQFILNHQSDFDLSVGTATHSKVYIKWKRFYSNYTPYKGRLIKVSIQCASGSAPRTLCFVMKGYGTHTLYVQISSSSKSGLYIGLGIAAACLVALVMIIIVVCYRKRSRSQPTNSTLDQPRNRASGQQIYLQQQYVQPTDTPGYEKSFPSSPPPEYTPNQFFQPNVNQQQYPMASIANQSAVITPTNMSDNQTSVINPVNVPNFQQAPVMMPAQ